MRRRRCAELRYGRGLRPRLGFYKAQEQPRQQQEVRSQALADQRTEVSMETRGTGNMGPRGRDTGSTEA